MRDFEKMGAWTMIRGILIACYFFVSFANAQETGKTTGEPKLQSVFNDDFRTDSCSDYEIGGDVTWESETLTLGNGASIQRENNGGGWAKLELDFAGNGWDSGDEKQEVQIRFLLDDATDCYVRLRQSPGGKGGHAGSVALVETGEQDGKLVTQVVRETSLVKGAMSRVGIEYRYGLVIVSMDGLERLSAYIENGTAAVIGSKVSVADGSMRLDGLRAMSLPAISPLTEDQKRQVAETKSVNQEMMAFFQLRNYAEAAKACERLLEIRRSVFGEQHPEVAESLNDLASLYKMAGAYTRAEPLFVQAGDIRKIVLGEKHPTYAKSLNDLAVLHMSMGKYVQAESLLVMAMDIQGEVLGENHPVYAKSLNNLAGLYELLGKYSRAEPLFVQAIEIQKNTLGEYHPNYAGLLNNLAFLYKSMGEHAEAEVLFAKARDIFKRALGEEHPAFAVSLNNLAVLYQDIGEHSRAERLYLQALEIRKKVLGEEHPEYAQGLNNLAIMYETLGEYSRAEPLFVKARDINKNALGEQHPNYALNLNNLASLYESIGEYARAEPLHKQACDIQKSALGIEHPRHALSLNNLAALYQSMGDYARAEPLYVQARDIRKKALGENHPAYAQSLNSLATLYKSMGEYGRAEPLFMQARDIYKEIFGNEHPDYASSLNNLAALFESMGEYGKAEPLRLAQRQILSDVAGRIVPTLSAAQSRNWMDKHHPRADLVTAVLRRQQKWDSSEAYTAVWATKGMVGRLQVGQSRSSAASPAAQEAFAQLRDARLKLAKLVSATPSSEQAADYVQALAEANERKESLEKTLAKLSTATAREMAVRDAKVDDLLQQLPEGVAIVDFVRLVDWQYVDNEITFKKENGDTETRTVKEEFANPVYDAFVLRPKRSAVANSPKWIPLGSAEPIETAIAAWRVGFASTGDASSDKRETSKELVNNPELKLRKLIWEKLEPHLDGIHTVVVIPDGDLNRLPWAALPGRNNGQYLLHDYALATAATGQQLFGVLVDPPFKTKPELLVVGGIEYDQRPQSRSAQSQPTFLAMNSRSLMRSDSKFGWNKLPGTQVEAAAIAQLWGDRGPVSELGSIQADEHSLARQLPQSRFAHLATHGFFDTRGEVYGTNLREQSLYESSAARSAHQSSVAARNPLLMTGIVMAGANIPPEKDDYGLPIGDDGILTAEEISGLDLRNTELVTLSACETGLGDIAAGQGVYGLTRVLHKSGVRSVLASQWKVSDRATQELMRRFYENLWSKKQSKIEALRNAQLWILTHPKELKAMGVKDATTRGKPRVLKQPTKNPVATKEGRTVPYFWAAFQLSGDWR